VVKFWWEKTDLKVTFWYELLRSTSYSSITLNIHVPMYPWATDPNAGAMDFQRLSFSHFLHEQTTIPAKDLLHPIIPASTVYLWCASF
jgi:hypothetical protein